MPLRIDLFDVTLKIHASSIISTISYYLLFHHKSVFRNANNHILQIAENGRRLSGPLIKLRKLLLWH